MMDENQERQLVYKVRQALAQTTDSVDAATLEKLRAARQAALAHAAGRVSGLRLAGLGHFISDTVAPQGRMIAAVATLLIGAAVSFYWNDYVQADENEEVDSALLADELPINAYLDPGFHAWLERSAPPSSP